MLTTFTRSRMSTIHRMALEVEVKVRLGEAEAVSSPVRIARTKTLPEAWIVRSAACLCRDERALEKHRERSSCIADGSRVGQYRCSARPAAVKVRPESGWHDRKPQNCELHQLSCLHAFAYEHWRGRVAHQLQFATGLFASSPCSRAPSLPPLCTHRLATPLTWQSRNHRGSAVGQDGSASVSRTYVALLHRWQMRPWKKGRPAG